MEQYMSKTRGNYGSGVARPKIGDKTHFELKEQFLKKLRENTFSGLEHEDVNKHIKKVLEIVDLFHIPEYCPPAWTAKKMEEINNFQQELNESLFRAWCHSHQKCRNAKVAIQEMAEYIQKWHNETSSKTKSTENFDGLAAIQAQLNSLGREIKKVNKKVYAAQVGCELCKGPHYTKDYPLKEEGKTLEEAYFT
ncbi:hypothetical protein Tco_0527923 [Tanacetum coccineum]